MPSLEETIVNVERIYSAVTGHEAPPADPSLAPIPAERDPVEHVEEQLTRLLGTLESSIPGATAWNGGMRFAPRLTIWESEAELLLAFDLPGVKRDEVDVSVHGDVLFLRGRRTLRGDAALRASEAPLGVFSRAIALRGPVSGGEPTAEMSDGVLTVRLRKDAQGAAPRSVPVS